MKFQRLIIVTILTERLPPSVSCGPDLHYTTEFEAFINEEQEAKQRSYRISYEFSQACSEVQSRGRYTKYLPQ